MTQYTNILSFSDLTILFLYFNYFAIIVFKMNIVGLSWSKYTHWIFTRHKILWTRGLEKCIALVTLVLHNYFFQQSSLKNKHWLNGKLTYHLVAYLNLYYTHGIIIRYYDEMKVFTFQERNEEFHSLQSIPTYQISIIFARLSTGLFQVQIQ